MWSWLAGSCLWTNGPRAVDGTLQNVPPTYHFWRATSSTCQSVQNVRNGWAHATMSRRVSQWHVQSIVAWSWSFKMVAWSKWRASRVPDKAGTLQPWTKRRSWWAGGPCRAAVGTELFEKCFSIDKQCIGKTAACRVDGWELRSKLAQLSHPMLVEPTQLGLDLIHSEGKPLACAINSSLELILQDGCMK